MQIRPNNPQELLPRVVLFEEGTGEIGGGGNGVLLLHSPHRHAQVLRFDYYRHAQGVQRVVDTFFDLRSEPFLHLQTPCESVHHAGNFAQSRNITVWNIGDMRLSKEGNQMMLAQGINLDILYDDHLPIVLFKLGGTQNLRWV